MYVHVLAVAMSSSTSGDRAKLEYVTICDSMNTYILEFRKGCDDDMVRLLKELLTNAPYLKIWLTQNASVSKHHVN